MNTENMKIIVNINIENINKILNAYNILMLINYN